MYISFLMVFLMQLQEVKSVTEHKKMKLPDSESKVVAPSCYYVLSCSNQLPIFSSMQ